MTFAEWLVPGFFVALALYVPRYGVDSRGPDPVRTHTITGDLHQLRRGLRRFADRPARARGADDTSRQGEGRWRRWLPAKPGR